MKFRGEYFFGETENNSNQQFNGNNLLHLISSDMEKQSNLQMHVDLQPPPPPAEAQCVMINC